MEKTYTYDAENITKGGVDQMRFELRDTTLVNAFDVYECFDLAVCTANAGKARIAKAETIFSKGEKMTIMEGGSETCLLCDEEYRAILESSKTWTNAKISCLKAIVMKLSYEVDYKVDKMSLTFSKRYENLKAMLSELEKKSQVPNFSKTATAEKPPYFYLGIQENKRSR